MTHMQPKINENYFFNRILAFEKMCKQPMCLNCQTYNIEKDMYWLGSNSADCVHYRVQKLKNPPRLSSSGFFSAPAPIVMGPITVMVKQTNQ